MEKLYKLEKSAKSRLGSECGSDHELLIAKFRLKLKEVGETTRPFRYDLNQIPYDYTVEGTNRFKGLGLVDSVPEELWTEVCNTVQEAVIKTIPKKKKCKKAKWLSEEALQLAVKRGEVRGKGEKERYTHLNAEFQLHQSLCVDHNKLWKILRDGNTRPPDLPPEKSVCRSGSNS